jgi:hypothetical protein
MLLEVFKWRTQCRLVIVYIVYKKIGLPPAKRFILSHRAWLSHIPFYCCEAMVTCARIQSSHAAWCCLMKSVVVRFQHHHVLSGASCVFIHRSSRGFVLFLSFWISSCTCCGTIAPFSLYWHHVHLLYLVIITLLLFVDLPLHPEQSIYQNIVLLKSLKNYLSNGYSFVLIGVRMRELWLFHFSTACYPEFQHVQPSVIWPYSLVGTSDCLAAWFIGT